MSQINLSIEVGTSLEVKAIDNNNGAHCLVLAFTLYASMFLFIKEFKNRNKKI